MCLRAQRKNLTISNVGCPNLLKSVKSSSNRFDDETNGIVSQNCQSGKCPVGEMSDRGNVRRGIVRREYVHRGNVLGVVSVGEMSRYPKLVIA